MRWLTLASLLLIAVPAHAQRKPDGNRLAYLDELDPYYPHKDFPKLITPQWVGDRETECVVVLAIDDMRDPKKYEVYLRPILRRLQEIDGRAPVSIMTCSVKPEDPQLQSWLKEGLSLECHTVDHPCPFFRNGFAKAKDTYERCIDLMHSIPGNKPVAFRMPCCDSLNTPSPRFWAEIFDKSTAKGHYLTIDSSVFNFFTSADPELPRELVLDEHGKERFTKYLPKDRSFVNTIENYPYPYVIGRLCWEFPCVTPSDWEAQHLQKPNNPITVRDMKAALDCAVVKKGVFCLVFHPHGWIRSDQVVELIDHAVTKHGKKVKFLTFKEAQERLDKNLLKGQPIRAVSGLAETNHSTGTRVLDFDNDGYMDVMIGGGSRTALSQRLARLWNPAAAAWKEMDFDVSFFQWTHASKPQRPGAWFRRDAKLSFGVLNDQGYADLIVQPAGDRSPGSFVHFDGQRWTKAKQNPLPLDTGRVKMRDLDQDGRCELIVERTDNDRPTHGVWRWSKKEQSWLQAPFALPKRQEQRASLDSVRFLDLDDDGKLDLLFSDEQDYGVYLFTGMESGWSKKVMSGTRADKDALPLISRNGTNNGFWAHSGHLWWSNEDTPLLKDHVDRREIKGLLQSAARRD